MIHIKLKRYWKTFVSAKVTRLKKFYKKRMISEVWSSLTRARKGFWAGLDFQKDSDVDWKNAAIISLCTMFFMGAHARFQKVSTLGQVEGVGWSRRAQLSLSGIGISLLRPWLCLSHRQIQHFQTGSYILSDPHLLNQYLGCRSCCNDG